VTLFLTKKLSLFLTKKCIGKLIVLGLALLTVSASPGPPQLLNYSLKVSAPHRVDLSDPPRLLIVLRLVLLTVSADPSPRQLVEVRRPLWWFLNSKLKGKPCFSTRIYCNIVLCKSVLPDYISIYYANQSFRTLP
jgi:hypothetical protein